MGRCLVCLVLSLACALPAAAEPGIAWLDDWKATLDRARANNRPVMVEFYTAWCLYCGKFEKETLADPRVVERSAGFVCARLDADVQKVAAARYRPEGFPTVVFAAPSGEEILRVGGHRTADEFLTVMRAVEEKGPVLLAALARLDQEPGDLAAREAAAGAYLEMGLGDRAAPHAQAALDRAAPADVPRLTLLRARAASAEEDWARATKLLAKLVQFSPDDPVAPDAWRELARAYEGWGKKAKAEEARAQLRARHPGAAQTPSR